MSREPGLPPAQGLYDPSYEHDACGVGFVVDMKGRKSHQIVQDALQILENLSHRGACGCEVNTGDGAGILVQIPDQFLRRICKEQKIPLPAFGDYGAGVVFLPQSAGPRERCQQIFTATAKELGLEVLGWRNVAVDNSNVGVTARSVEPVMQMVFVGRGVHPAGEVFERKLFLLRKFSHHEIHKQNVPEAKYFYLPSLSWKTLIYKGMLTSEQLRTYFSGLNCADFQSALALVHSRFSTNTFPSWPLAHPFRYVAHNGEINTLRGNVNWFRARERLFKCSAFTSAELDRLIPVINDQGSDSAILDNALEMLVMGGRSLPHAVMMMIPEAWAQHESMSQEKRDFYEFHSCLMEPWDGPASVAFTDGTVIGAVLDRNGLRPSRYYVTKDDKVIMASEVGVLDIPPERVLMKGRLQPGRMFLVDMKEGRIVADEELKQRMATAQPYGKWLKENLVKLEELPAPPHVHEPDHETVFQRQQAFGYTSEDLKIILQPMAVNGEEPLGSMGNDAALAVLSDKPQVLYNYFKQLFAQVTNPPLDAIREELVTDVGTSIGPEANLLEPGPQSCRQIKVKTPVLDNEELARLRHCPLPDFKAETVPMLFEVPADGPDGAIPPGAASKNLESALSNLCTLADSAIAKGVKILILSDRESDAKRAPVPALLAVGCLHHHLVRQGLRTRVGLVVESGEPREVHHFALLLGYGAGAVNPYLAFETLDDLLRDGVLGKDIDHKKAVKNYIKAINKGVVKVMSKMGISTIQSYRGAQIFEAIGLNSKVVDRYFTGTASRIEGIGMEEIAKEQIARHAHAHPKREEAVAALDAGGQYQWRRDGEYHLFNPDTVHKLQYAVRANNYKTFKEYSKLVDEQSRKLCTLRGLFDLKPAQAIPIEQVESVEEIVKRFATGAMSYGSISKEAHENLAIAMNRLGGRSNTGEGGEDEDRFDRDPNGDWRNSAIKQVASARFGVTSRYLVSANELQIKIAQGAKPGEGGQLPAHKVYPWIAKTRHATAYVGLISPPPHHDIYSIEDLAQLIYDLKNGNPKARISVKLVAEVGVGTVAAGVSKAHSDVVLIAGHDGGTGASPLTSIKHAGIPWELGVAETQQVLVMNDLRGRIVLQADGQLKTGRDVIIAALLGAEEFGFATTALVASGCIMMRVCHLDTCPVGVATQNPELRKKFAGKPEHVVNFMRFIAQEVREYMAQLGFRTIDEMVGCVDRLDTNKAIKHWKARGLDFTRIFQAPKPHHPGTPVRKVQEQDHGVATWLDNKLIEACSPALNNKESVRLDLPIRNTHRTTGTMLGSELTRRYPEGLPDDTIHLKFTGSAGQSLGAFLPKGITIELEGDSNDYFGKGLSGGRLIVYPSKSSTYKAEENIIIGNVACYGATSGEIFVSGVAGERFCVRNSGVHAVVEGLGDHGCEYMTGGRVVVLGRTGRNFAAGMSGGIAYVLDEAGDLAVRCNKGMVGLEKFTESEDLQTVRAMLEKHLKYTGSAAAARVLKDWNALLPKFVKVMPTDYKRALELAKQQPMAAAGND